MKNITIILAIALTLSSCSVLSPNKQGCGTERDVIRHDSRPFRVMTMKEGGTITNSLKPRKATLLSVRRTAKGIKHTFVTESSDTLVEYYPKQFFKVGECYLIKII